jgi:hypothetical protein
MTTIGSTLASSTSTTKNYNSVTKYDFPYLASSSKQLCIFGDIFEMSDISSGTSPPTNDCGTPSCTMRVQKTTVASVCGNSLSMNSANHASSNPFNYPDDSSDYLQWLTTDNTVCVPSSSSVNNYAS